MAFKRVSLPREYHKLADYSAGDILCEGTYVSTHENKFGTLNHVFRNEAENKDHVLSGGHLTWLAKEQLSFGDYTRVTYSGTQILEKGNFKGKESHQFELETDDDRRIGGLVNEPEVADDEESQDMTL